MNAKKGYYVTLIAYIAILMYAFYYNFTMGYIQALLMSFISVALIGVVPFLFKIMKWKPVYEIYTLALVFIAIASLFGSSLRFYKLYIFWDKLAHTFSGVLGILLGYSLFCSLKKVAYVNKKDVPLLLIFINAINISIAALWEQYEYLCLLIADYDAINHYSSGVHDSMGDIGFNGGYWRLYYWWFIYNIIYNSTLSKQKREFYYEYI